MGRLVAVLRRELHTRESAARDFREREIHADSQRQLAAQEPSLCEAFGSALNEQFASGVSVAKNVLPSVAEVQFDQLELMDDWQVQESVNLARSQQSALLTAEASLAELNTLICATLGLTLVRPDRNPLRPAKYIQALRIAIERTAVPAAMRLDWMAVMGAALGRELDALYHELAHTLRGQGVTPVGYGMAPLSSGSSGAGAAISRTAGHGGATMSEITRYGAPGSVEREALIAQEMRRPKSSVDPALLTLDRLRLLLAGELGATSASHRVAAFAAQFAQEFESGASAAGRQDAQTTDFAATVPAAFEALAEMKQIDRVVQRIEERRHSATGAGAQEGGSPQDQIRRSASGVAQALGVEVVSLMVDNIARDPRLLEPVQGLVRSLEPALMRLALVDPRFFIDKGHAARMLIQELTHRSLAFAKPGSPGFLVFLDEAREAIAPLMHDAVNPSDFDAVLHGLQALWHDEAAKQALAREQAVKALERAEQRNLLAEKIARDIDKHPDARKVPEVVMVFLCGPWAQVVAQARLAGGSRSAAADRYQALISALLWSTHPDLAPGNIPKLTKLVPLLLGTLRDGLETIQYPAKKVGAFFESLMAIHQSVFRAVNRESLSQAKLQDRQAPRDNTTAEPQRPVQDGNPWVAPSEALESNLLELDEMPAHAVHASASESGAPAQDASVANASTGVDSLPLGSWIELCTSGEWVRTQLTWASPHGTLFLFTSATGATQSMTRRTHDKLLAAGQLRVVATQPVLDTALDAVAQQAMQNSVISKLD
jgi:hypothetical protein